MKVCKHCSEEKPKSEFYENKRMADGLFSNCKSCHSDIQKARKEADPDRRKEISLKSCRKTKYGLSVDDFQAMWHAQGDKCAICSQPLVFGTGGYAVDHNHETGVVRGLLCVGCNTGLGNFKDNPSIMARGIEYLHAKGNYAYDA